MDNHEKKLYNVTETGKVLGVGRNRVYSLIKNGYLKALDIGGFKVPSSEIDRFISEYEGYSFKNMDNPTRM